MMQATCPIDCNIGMSRVYSSRSIHTSTCADGAEFEKAIKSWIVFADQDFCTHVAEVSDFVSDVLSANETHTAFLSL
jgi:hypothetical protein